MTPREKLSALIKAGNLQNLKQFIDSQPNKFSLLNQPSTGLRQNCIFESV